MSETPQETLLDLVRVQYEANEEMTRLLKAAEAERDALRAWQQETTAQMLYIAGIVERGEGKPIPDDERVPQAILRYVKALEAERDALRAEVARERRERISAESGCETQAAARYVAEAERNALRDIERKHAVLVETIITLRAELRQAEVLGDQAEQELEEADAERDTLKIELEKLRKEK